MALNIISARNPVWCNSEHNAIDLYVVFAHIPNELHFTATPCDHEEHGRTLYIRALNGDFGEIAEYIPPPPKTIEEESEIVRQRRDQLLYTTDWTQAFDIPQETKDKWIPYRQSLRDIPQQAGFPYNVTWPSI